MAWWADLWRTRAKDWSFGPVDAPGSDPGRPRQPLRADEQYISVNLRALRIANVRVGRQRLYGVVTGSTSVLRRGGGWAESLVVSTPQVLRDVDPDNLDRVVTGTTRLLGPVPYRGGGIDLELGLFTAPGKDLLGPYLAMLEKTASLAGVGLVAREAGIVGLVKDGLNAVLGGRSDQELEIGLAHLFDQPQAGHYAVVRVDQADGRQMPAVAENGHLHWRDGAPVTEPYLVFSIDQEEQRDDWAGIPPIHAAYEHLRTMAERGDLTGAKEGLATFRRTVAFSPDLLLKDCDRLCDLVESQIEKAFPSTGTDASTGGFQLPDLSSLKLFG